MRVCVVGGGPAGVGAAAEAAWRGAKVCLLEREEALPPPKPSWAGLVACPKDEGNVPLDELQDEGVEVMLGSEASAVGAGMRVCLPRGPKEFDRVVLATGSAFGALPFPGYRTPGVFVLDRLGAFLQLGRRAGSISRAAVSGEGLIGVEVADALSRIGKQVTLFAPGGLSSKLGPRLAPLVEEAAAKRGVLLVDGRVDRASGAGRLEAVVSGGRVFPADALAVIPKQTAALPRVAAAKDGAGRLKVDRNMRSTDPGLFGAGLCARVEGALVVDGVGSPWAAASGRIAAANACGQSLTFAPSGAVSVTFFGLRYFSAGPTLDAALAAGLDCAEAVALRQPSSSCIIVYERRTGRTLGVQMVNGSGDEASSLVGVAVSQSLHLRTLAYNLSSSSTDITLVSEAARQAMSEGASSW